MRLLYLRCLSLVAVGSLASLVTITASSSVSGPAQGSAGEAPVAQGPHKSYSRIIVFGDSLSDDGSGAWELTKHAWPRDSAYDEGRFCNGPVWVEHLARWVRGEERTLMERGKVLAGTRLPWLDDRAFGGATLDNARNQGRTGYRSDIPVPAVKDQVQRYLRERDAQRLNDSTLFIVGGGGNDGYFAHLAHHDLQHTADESASLLLAQLRLLISAGGRHFLVPARPDLSRCPYGLEALSEHDRAELSRYASALFQRLKTGVRDILREEKDGVRIALVEQSQVYNLQAGRIPLSERLVDIQDDSVSSLELKNTTAACLRGVYPGVDDGVRSLCAEPDEYLFWDAYHLTTKGHYLLALRALEALHAAGDPLAQNVRAASWSATLDGQVGAKEGQAVLADPASIAPLVFQS